MKFEAKNLSPVAFHALTCAEVSVSIQCFDWSKMAAEGFPVARIDEYAKPCEPAIHVLRSVAVCHQKRSPFLSPLSPSDPLAYALPPMDPFSLFGPNFDES